MSSGQSLFEAFSIMLICIFMGLVLTIVFGIGNDSIRNEFVNAGFYNIQGPWLSVQNPGNIDILTNLIYIMCYFIPFFGVLNFIVTCVRRTRYDAYGNPIEEM